MKCKNGVNVSFLNPLSWKVEREVTHRGVFFCSRIRVNTRIYIVAFWHRWHGHQKSWGNITLATLKCGSHVSVKGPFKPLGIRIIQGHRILFVFLFIFHRLFSPFFHLFSIFFPIFHIPAARKESFEPQTPIHNSIAISDREPFVESWCGRKPMRHEEESLSFGGTHWPNFPIGKTQFHEEEEEEEEEIIQFPLFRWAASTRDYRYS